ncbi:hypothetical protein N8611_01475 [bacterium]|nr:hypothetical protein [bacterium]
MAHDSEAESAELSTREGIPRALFRVTEKEGIGSREGSSEREGEALDVVSSLVDGEEVLDSGAGAGFGPSVCEDWLMTGGTIRWTV